MRAQYLPGAPARLPFVIVGFDDRAQGQSRIDCRQTRRKPEELFAVILGRQPTREKGYLSPARKEAPEKLAGNRTDRE